MKQPHRRKRSSSAGAGLAGMAAGLAPGLDVPLIDSVIAGAKAAWRMAGASAHEWPAASRAAWHGVSETLLRRLG